MTTQTKHQHKKYNSIKNNFANNYTHFLYRHIEGREFCYAYDDGENGRVRICAKCCLNNRCNNGLLTVSWDKTVYFIFLIKF